jgi:triosephosphate isomerase
MLWVDSIAAAQAKNRPAAAPHSGRDDIMAARQPLIAGNWKMNGLRAGGVALAEAVAKGAGGLSCAFVVCPPATLLAPVAAALKGSRVGLGGQDCHSKDKGAHTGDISAAMLADIGCNHVIVGHSERRTDHGETDAAVHAKALAAHAAGLVAIVCVGESEAERDGGRTLDVVGRQVKGSVPSGATAANTVVAYEPVWAIGSGRTPTPAQIREVHGHIRKTVAACLGKSQADGMRLLYGGSVKPSNAAEILALDDVDGALVGGASLVAEDFLGIGKSCP